MHSKRKSHTPGSAFLGNQITINTDFKNISNIRQYDIAIIGVEEDRNSIVKGSAESPDKIREKLYAFAGISKNLKIIDLGNLKKGNTINDTYYGLRDIIAELLNMDVAVVLLGGSQDLTYSVYLAYQILYNNINLVSVDSRIGLDLDQENFNSGTYLKKILQDKNKCLFDYTNIGHQMYYVDQEDLKMINKKLYYALRLGELRGNIIECEPFLRDADMLSFNISAVRQSDAPACSFPSPSGFAAEEACQIARYAGISDKLYSFGIYEIIPESDVNGATSSLAAQMIWYFIDGFGLRKQETPTASDKEYKKFIVSLNNLDQDIIFYKSQKTNRWWFEVPDSRKGKSKTKLVACSYKDYIRACDHEIPDRWLKTYQKIS